MVIRNSDGTKKDIGFFDLNATQERYIFLHAPDSTGNKAASEFMEQFNKDFPEFRIELHDARRLIEWAGKARRKKQQQDQMASKREAVKKASAQYIAQKRAKLLAELSKI